MAPIWALTYLLNSTPARPRASIPAIILKTRDSTAVTDIAEFPDQRHSLTIDSGWREVADSCLSWLDAREL